MKNEQWFEIQLGMRNPRDEREIGWRSYGYYADLQEAKREVRANKLTFYRIVKQSTVAERIPDSEGETFHAASPAPETR